VAKRIPVPDKPLSGMDRGVQTGQSMAGRTSIRWTVHLRRSVLWGNVALRVQLRRNSLYRFVWDSANLKFTNAMKLTFRRREYRSVE